MNVMVMDVEGTDGRERGEDQVLFTHVPIVLALVLIKLLCRTLRESRLCSRWHHQRSSSLIYGNIK